MGFYFVLHCMPQSGKAWEFVSVFPDEKRIYGKRISESKWQSNYTLQVNGSSSSHPGERGRRISSPDVLKLPTTPSPTIQKKRRSPSPTTFYQLAETLPNETTLPPVQSTHIQPRHPNGWNSDPAHFEFTPNDITISLPPEQQATESSVAGSRTQSQSIFCDVTSSTENITIPYPHRQRSFSHNNQF